MSRVIVLLVALVVLSVQQGIASAGGDVAAPTEARILGDVLSWVDNSDNEEGFRVTVRNDDTGPRFKVTLPANTTEVAIPAEYQMSCGVRDAIFFEVIAFTGTAESQPALGGIVGDCVLPTPTGGAPTALPPAVETVVPTQAIPTRTGPTLPSTGSGGGPSDGPGLVLAFGLALVGAAAGAFTLLRPKAN